MLSLSTSTTSAWGSSATRYTLRPIRTHAWWSATGRALTSDVPPYCSTWRSGNGRTPSLRRRAQTCTLAALHPPLSDPPFFHLHALSSLDTLVILLSLPPGHSLVTDLYHMMLQETHALAESGIAAAEEVYQLVGVRGAAAGPSLGPQLLQPGLPLFSPCLGPFASHRPASSGSAASTRRNPPSKRYARPVRSGLARPADDAQNDMHARRRPLAPRLTRRPLPSSRASVCFPPSTTSCCTLTGRWPTPSGCTTLP